MRSVRVALLTLLATLSTPVSAGELILKPQQIDAPEAARTGHSSVIWGNRLYILGGQTTTAGGDDGSSYLRSVVSAELKADGGLGPFREETALPVPRGYHATVATGGNLYVIGGFKDETPGNIGMVSGILRSRVDPSTGQLGPWEVVNSGMKFARGEATVMGDQLYVVGGLTSTGSSSNRVWSLEIREDGSLGEPTYAGDMAMPHQRFAMVSTRGALVAVGGYRPDDYKVYSRAIEVIPLEDDGEMGQPLLVEGLKVGRANLDGVLVGDHLVLVGGHELGHISGRVEVATLDDKGSVTAWDKNAWLRWGRANHTVEVAGTSLYIIGGADYRGICETIDVIPLTEVIDGFSGGVVRPVGLPAVRKPAPAAPASPAEMAPASPVEMAPAAPAEEAAPAAPVNGGTLE